MSDNQKTKGYDGVTKVKTPDGEIITFLNIYEALEQDNPRNIFLNGQLYVENRLDTIISMYFGYDNNIRHASILNFLKSRYCDFFSKIKLLSMLINKYDGKNEVPLIENKDVISSLQTIGEIRNSFQHNLIFEEAIKNSIKDGRTFKLTGRKLDTCGNLNGLIEAFKKEVIKLTEELDKIIINKIPHYKIDMETLKKTLTGHSFDNDKEKS